MGFKIEFLWTDSLLFMLSLAVVMAIAIGTKRKHWQLHLQHLLSNSLGVSALMIIISFLTIALLDSCHYHKQIVTESKVSYSSQAQSLLDDLLSPIGINDEETYSAPFASHLFVKSSVIDQFGKQHQEYKHLKYSAVGIDSEPQKMKDILSRLRQGVLIGFVIWFSIIFTLALIKHSKWQMNLAQAMRKILFGKSQAAWKAFAYTLLALILFISSSFCLSRNYHIFGTNTIGVDVFYLSLKSIRTGIIIGLLTTLVMLPFATTLGMMAGYFGGIIDDVIQYIYTTLNSIPGVLLIAASVLSIQVFITNHASLFPTIAMRADIRLLSLCCILGMTSWTGLCRLLRAETLKLRELDYIQAAKALGLTDLKILFKHILPNVLPIIVISIVIDFSSLVLAEAVLSYVGVGVDPSTISWGNMINSARLQLSREPTVWWPLLAAFLFMFLLVLAANLFSDAVRDAFDPKLRQQ